MHEYDSIIVSHKDRAHFSAMVKVPDRYASDSGSIPGQISEFFCKFYLVCLIRRELWKNLNGLKDAFILSIW